MTLKKNLNQREQDKFVETTDASTAVRVMDFGKLVPDSFDYIALTYVAAGNGEGEIETVVYKEGGSGGTTIATLTLTYDSDNKLTAVTKV
jgi:hypothetical protein